MEVCWKQGELKKELTREEYEEFVGGVEHIKSGYLSFYYGNNLENKIKGVISYVRFNDWDVSILIRVDKELVISSIIRWSLV